MQCLQHEKMGVYRMCVHVVTTCICCAIICMTIVLNLLIQFPFVLLAFLIQLMIQQNTKYDNKIPKKKYTETKN